MTAERKPRTPVETQACWGHSEERPGFAAQRAAGRSRSQAAGSRIVRASVRDISAPAQRSRLTAVVRGSYSARPRAEVAELADALDSGSSARKGVGVQIPPSAPRFPSLSTHAP